MDVAAVLRCRLLGSQLLSLRAGGGVVAGLLAAAGLAAGLPVHLLTVLIAAAAAADWVAGRAGSEDRLEGFAVGVLVGLAVSRGMLADAGWEVAGCRGFTAGAWRAGLGLAVAPVGLAIVARRLADRPHRLAALATVAALSILATVRLAPGCIG